VTIDLAAPASAACDAAADKELRALFSARARSVFRDNEAEEWSAEVACHREHQTEHFQSWKCIFEQSSVGAYLDYQVVGISAVAESAGLMFVEPLDFCVGTARAKLIEAAVRAASEPAREALQRLQQNGALAPSTFRTAKSLTFSFTDDLPHVLDGVATVALPIERVTALCGPGDARATMVLGRRALRRYRGG